MPHFAVYILWPAIVEAASMWPPFYASLGVPSSSRGNRVAIFSADSRFPPAERLVRLELIKNQPSRIGLLRRLTGPMSPVASTDSSGT
jgi:hypothetical protein